MDVDLQQFNDGIEERLRRFDIPGAEARCVQLVDHLLQCGNDYPPREAARTLQLLRRKRMFTTMLRVGDAFLQTGRHSTELRRLYAQALIDTGALTAALAVLNDYLPQTADDPFQNREARGLMGRVYKQIYINARGDCAVRNRDCLYHAIAAYLDVYRSNPTERLWHGINAVALLNRAIRDGIPIIGFPNPADLAKSAIDTVKARHQEGKAEAWDFATAMEASVALNQPEEALIWLQLYAQSPGTDAFEIASTLRQLTEVWQLTSDASPGRFLLPILRAELLQREGGAVEITPHEHHADLGLAAKFQLEKLLGADSFQSYQWYLTGLQRCQRVGRIGRDPSKGDGTGFLLQGSQLSPKFGQGLVLLTNAHVVSNDPAVQTKHRALPPEEAIVVFETLGPETYEVTELLWTSPPDQLDTTVLRISNEGTLQDKLDKVPSIEMAKALPALEPPPRVYIIGYPAGGTLSISLNDNLLLDHEDPRLHYRTPTQGGSSGSPVFNRQWKLIGLHHAGSETMPRLNGQPGTYPANEGIYLDAIKRAIPSSAPSVVSET